MGDLPYIDRLGGRAFLVVSTVLIGLLSFSCRSIDVPADSDGARPNWIDQPGVGAAEGEIVGVGSGPNREAAIDAALARLAQAIEVRVEAIEETVLQSDVQEGAGARRSHANASLDRTIRLMVDQRLPGASVDHVWRARGGDTFYARATLDRRRAAEQFDATAQSAMRDASLSLIRSNSMDPGWRRLRELSEARRTSLQALEAAETRDVLHQSAWEISVADVRELCDAVLAAWIEAQNAVRINVVAMSRDAEDLAAQVEGSLARQSLPLAEFDADIVIECRFSVVSRRSFDPNQRAAEWTASLTAREARSRRSLATRRFTGAEMARTDAVDRCKAAAAAKIEESLPSFLDELFLAR